MSIIDFYDLATYGYIGMLIVMVLIYANLGVLINSIFKYVIGPLITGWRHQKEPSQPQQQPALQHSPTGADHLSSPNIERLLSITESSTKLLHAFSETLLANKQQSTGASGVQMLEPGECRTPTPAVSSNDSIEVDTASQSPSLAVPNQDDIQLEVESKYVNSDQKLLDDAASDDDIVILEHFDEAASPID